MHPLTALDISIERAFLHDAPRRPGAVIEKLPTKTRDALQELTSDQMLSLRTDIMFFGPKLK